MLTLASIAYKLNIFFTVFILRLFKLIQILFILKKSYQSIPSYSISKQYRITQEPSNSDLIYGELSVHAFLYLLALIPKKNNALIYDLGCGDGKLLLSAVLFFKNLKAIGIEKVADLQKIAALLALSIQANSQKNHSTLIFLHQDFLDTDFSDANIVYINGAALKQTTWQQVCSCLKSLSENSYVISVERKVELPLFTLEYAGIHHASWGKARVYIYKKETAV
jgi:SAM-dependent methyltransferase